MPGNSDGNHFSKSPFRIVVTLFCLRVIKNIAFSRKISSRIHEKDKRGHMKRARWTISTLVFDFLANSRYHESGVREVALSWFKIHFSSQIFSSDGAVNVPNAWMTVLEIQIHKVRFLNIIILLCSNTSVWSVFINILIRFVGKRQFGMGPLGEAFEERSFPS